MNAEQNTTGNSTIESNQTAEISGAPGNAAPEKSKQSTGSIFRKLRSQPMNGLDFSVDPDVNSFLPLLVIAMAVLLLLLIITIPAGCNTFFVHGEPSAPIGDDIPDQPTETGSSIDTPGSHPFADGEEGDVLLPYDENIQIPDESRLNSTRAAVVDVSTGTIVAARLSGEKMYPASLTKIMTMIVAVENLPEKVSLSHKITISKQVVEAMALENASGVGLEAGEKLTVEALLYMTVLQSDGTAATELARYISGSEKEFVVLMNRKASSMGLVNTHFSNCTGLQDEGNYSTCRDMATILNYAMNMSLCRQILTASSYTAPCTSNKGKSFSYNVTNALLVTKLKNEYPSSAPKNVTITAGKTGWTGKNSGYCLASYAVAPNGHAYIVVTSQADNSYLDCIKDHTYLYETYVK